jgi:hypothetical protein
LKKIELDCGVNPFFVHVYKTCENLMITRQTISHGDKYAWRITHKKTHYAIWCSGTLKQMMSVFDHLDSLKGWGEINPASNAKSVHYRKLRDAVRAAFNA